MGFYAIEKSSGRNVKNFAKAPQAARANPVRAAFVFLNLLKCHADLVGQLSLAVSSGFPQDF